MERTPRLTLRAVVVAGAFVGLLLAGMMMWIAWQHNAQGEIHGPDGIDWAYWGLIGLSWFLLPTGIGAVGALLVAVGRRRARDRENTGAPAA